MQSRLHSEKQLRCVARRDVVLNLGSALVTVRKAGGLGASGRLVGSALQEENTGRPRSGALLRAHDEWLERWPYHSLDDSRLPSPLVYQVPRMTKAHPWPPTAQLSPQPVQEVSTPPWGGDQSGGGARAVSR